MEVNYTEEILIYEWKTDKKCYIKRREKDKIREINGIGTYLTKCWNINFRTSKLTRGNPVSISFNLSNLKLRSPIPVWMRKNNLILSKIKSYLHLLRQTDK